MMFPTTLELERRGPTFLILSPIVDGETALHHHAELTETVVIEDAAHWLHLDQPERFARVLDRILAEIE